MVSEDFVAEHKEAMRRRLQDIMAYHRRKKIEQGKFYIEEQKRRIRMGQLRQRRFMPEIEEILKPIAARHGLTLRELSHINRSKPAIRARKEGIVALYYAFPDKHPQWYTRPFGYVRSHTTLHHMRTKGLLPPLPSKGKKS